MASTGLEQANVLRLGGYTRENVREFTTGGILLQPGFRVHMGECTLVEYRGHHTQLWQN